MLASEVFANLKKWADVQHGQLKSTLVAQDRLIPFNAVLDDGSRVTSAAQVSESLAHKKMVDDSVSIIVLDGPAGIGKTTLIEQLARFRAEKFKATGDSLVLHVKSRGRVLSNLLDLMAYSLQTLRLSITYDQVPVLVKHGLVILAIDGFDELGDPNGYEMAWAQIDDLVESVRGKGMLILSGRDTFIGREQVAGDIKAVRTGIDEVAGISLDVPSPAQAKEWLKLSGWQEDNFEMPVVAGIFEQDSYALRPVFLRLLSEIKPRQLKEKRAGFVTTLLVDHMIERESTKFGQPIEAVLSRERLGEFLRVFLCELAREMADTQSDALDDSTISWISETAFAGEVPSELISIVRNRASVVAFLEADERSGFKRFVHTQLSNYFLAHVAIDAIGAGDVPKFVRRNILGAEFLGVFNDVVVEKFDSDTLGVVRFLNSAMSLLSVYTFSDRADRNLGALLICSLALTESVGSFSIVGVHVDEAVFRGTASRALLHDVVVSQLDVRGSDLSAVNFTSFTVVRLIADDSTALPKGFPNPALVKLPGMQQIADAAQISEWVARHGGCDSALVGSTSANRIRELMSRTPIGKLLSRIVRFRQYWLRDDAETLTGKTLQDPLWPRLAGALRTHGLLREEERPASGNASMFFHVKKVEQIRGSSDLDDDVSAFFAQLLQEEGL